MKKKKSIGVLGMILVGSLSFTMAADAGCMVRTESKNENTIAFKGKYVEQETTPTEAGAAVEISVIEDNPTATDLDYWYIGMDAEVYKEKIRQAAFYVPTPGVGYCASWVSYVYQSAGLGFTGGNACDMWRLYCSSNDPAMIEAGQMIAVPSSPTSELGIQFGHVGIIILNPSYSGTDHQKELRYIGKEYEKIQLQINELEEKKENHAELDEQLKKLGDEYLRLQDDENVTYIKVHGQFDIPVDENGNIKWLVADSTTYVGCSSIADWINTYDYLYMAAWGYPHGSTPVEWSGDILSYVPFVYHAQEATEQDLEAESTEAVTEETTTAEGESTAAVSETSLPADSGDMNVQPETPAAEPEADTQAAEPETTAAYTEPETAAANVEPETITVYTEPETTTVYVEPETTIAYVEPQTEAVYLEPEYVPEQEYIPEPAYIPEEGYAAE